MASFDWTLIRVYGPPHCDGYASGVLDVGEDVVVYNLGKNSVYKIQPKMADPDIDGYFNVMSDDGTETDVTDLTGEILRNGEDRILVTSSHRHWLSIKCPDGSSNSMSVRIIKLESGKTQNENS